MKKKLYISGNCITETLPRFLNTNSDFNKIYEVKSLKPVYLIKPEDVEEYKNAISECDVFLTQPIVGQHYVDLGIDTNSIKKLLKPNAKIINIPVPYFQGYFPEQIYLYDSAGNVIPECEGLPSPYHNKIILYGHIHGLSPKRVLEILNSDLNIKNISQILEDTYKELNRREDSVAFGITNFMKKNYQKRRLYWTINHPTNYLLRYMAEEILKYLGFKKHWYNFGFLTKNIKKEFLDKPYMTPIINSVRTELNIKFVEPNIKYTLQYIEAVYKYYDSHPDLVESNAHKVEDLYIINNDGEVQNG